jgi:hypothetical protein
MADEPGERLVVHDRPLGRGALVLAHRRCSSLQAATERPPRRSARQRPTTAVMSR